MCVCVFMYMFVYIYVCMYVFVCVCAYACVNIHKHEISLPICENSETVKMMPQTLLCRRNCVLEERLNH